ncbi:CD225/dispanin family protein [Lysobacter enzymogenes]|uniref:CD225/dispanin family protein n=1 Tax=Lysobacter enzymogenes TaxID=69 RepID=UPI00384ECCD0
MNQPVAATPPYPNYLVWSIIVTVLGACFCCLLGAAPGVVAIVFGSQVSSKFAAGDDAGARRASEQAKLWCWIGTALVAVGVLWTILSFFINGMSFVPNGGLERLMQGR